MNTVVRGQLMRRLAILFRVSPRMLMQRGRLGKFLRRVSKSEIELPDGLSKLEWIGDS